MAKSMLSWFETDRVRSVVRSGAQVFFTLPRRRTCPTQVDSRGIGEDHRIFDGLDRSNRLIQKRKKLRRVSELGSNEQGVPVLFKDKDKTYSRSSISKKLRKDRS